MWYCFIWRVDVTPELAVKTFHPIESCGIVPPYIFLRCIGRATSTSLGTEAVHGLIQISG